MDYDTLFDPYRFQADEDETEEGVETPAEAEEDEWAVPEEEELGEVAPDGEE